LIDVLFQLAVDASTAHARSAAVDLLSQIMAVAHGYATLVMGDGGPGLEPLSVDETVQRSLDASRTLIAGHRVLHPSNP